MSTALKWLLGIAMTAGIVLAFTYAPEAVRPNYGTLDAAGNPVLEPWPSFRIFFFHVPSAWIAVLAFGVAAVASVRTLRRPQAAHDDVAASSSELGLLFAGVALASGMVWARLEWGAFWSWDPRQNSILVLMLIYAGYFTLRSSIPDPLRKARLAAVYSLVAFMPVVFLVFVVPRIMESLHPSPIIDTGGDSGAMDPRMRQVFFLFLATFTGLYAWMLSLRVRSVRVVRRVTGAEAGGL